MQLFDTHCHLDVSAFDHDRLQVLHEGRQQGVSDLLLPGIQRSDWAGLTALCSSDPKLHLALGLHPMFIGQHRPEDLQALHQQISLQQPLAIGEIGLDYQQVDADRALQQTYLEEQLAIAEHFQLPVVLHIRKAHDPVIATLKRYRLCGGFCHAFNGSLQQAGRYLDMGFRFGFGGMLTYKGSTRLHRLASDLPLDSIVLETDAPDMTGQAHQYQRNSPAYLPEVARVLAELRKVPVGEIAQTTTRNARMTLGLME